jgi:hypothetical protein
MFDSDKPDVYEKVYQELLPRMAGVDLVSVSQALGLARDGDSVMIPCLGRRYLAGADGITAEDGEAVLITHRIVLAYYLLHGGRGEASGRFVPYRELPGGQDFARSLSQIVETPLAQSFSGRLEDLNKAAMSLGASKPETEINADAVFTFEALPKLPLMLTFYDADEDFPAEAKVFYDLTAPNFLDMECLAALGHMLALELEAAASPSG